jgi:hypothetical protein
MSTSSAEDLRTTLRAKSLSITDKHLKLIEAEVAHIRSDGRRVGRVVSRMALHKAMTQERGLVDDVAKGTGVDERAASRSIVGRLPFDIGDILAVAKAGRASCRLMRVLLSLLRDELDSIESHT